MKEPQILSLVNLKFSALRRFTGARFFFISLIYFCWRSYFTPRSLEVPKVSLRKSNFPPCARSCGFESFHPHPKFRFLGAAERFLKEWGRNFQSGVK